MKLKSFGCSFIFGSDLADDGRNLPIPTPSNRTWPAHLAKHLGYSYECYARPGAGNLQIAERVLTTMVGSADSVFVIGWTYIDRFDYTNSAITNDPILARWNNWHTIRPMDQGSLAQTYYRDLHSEYRDKLNSLMCIKLVIDTLKQKSIPFLMTNMDSLLFDQRWNHTPAVIELQEYVSPYIQDFEGQNFLNWSRKQGYEISPSMHPLEQAHAAATEIMLAAFDKQKTSDPIRPVRV
jgi:hypothetical protein